MGLKSKKTLAALRADGKKFNTSSLKNAIAKGQAENREHEHEIIIDLPNLSEVDAADAVPILYQVWLKNTLKHVLFMLFYIIIYLF